MPFAPSIRTCFKAITVMQECKDGIADLAGAMPAYQRTSEEMSDAAAQFERVRDASIAATLTPGQLFRNPWYVRALLRMENNATSEMETVGVIAALICSFVAALVMEPPQGSDFFFALTSSISFYTTLSSTLVSTILFARFRSVPPEMEVDIMRTFGLLFWIPIVLLLIGGFTLFLAMVPLVAINYDGDDVDDDDGNSSLVKRLRPATIGLTVGCILMLALSILSTQGLEAHVRENLSTATNEMKDAKKLVASYNLWAAEESHHAVKGAIEPKVAAFKAALQKLKDLNSKDGIDEEGAEFLRVFDW